jgi:N,N'-diacetylchitobiose phosphorylase
MPRAPDQNAPAGDLGSRGYILTFPGRAPGPAHYQDHVLTGPAGLEILVRDLASGEFWLAGRGTAGGERNGGEATLIDERDGLRAAVTIALAPDAPAEVRTVTLTNLGRRPRRLDVTTFAEVVLHDPRAHAAHPAFSKLFVQTEFVAGAAALVVSRRPRDPGERHPWLVHASLDGGPVEFETDRARFLGRGRGAARPAAMGGPSPLSGTCGNVLDPCLSLRRTVTLAPGASASLAFLLGVADDRAGALALARRGRGEAVAAAATAALPVPAAADAPNGHGRFDDDGREYVIHLRRRPDGSLVLPPRPWINVIANETFGCLVSETGAGTTWCGNSREHRLTPWFNDPVLDPHGDAVFLRDEDRGAAWSCWPGPAPAPVDYEVRHGFGYTRCRHAHDDLAVDTLVFVARPSRCA